MLNSPLSLLRVFGIFRQHDERGVGKSYSGSSLGGQSRPARAKSEFAAVGANGRLAGPGRGFTGVGSLARCHRKPEPSRRGASSRGEATPNSDVDLLVEMEPGRTLLDLARLASDLKAALGRKVDVVTEKSIYWLLRRRILKEAKSL